MIKMQLSLLWQLCNFSNMTSDITESVRNKLRCISYKKLKREWQKDTCTFICVSGEKQPEASLPRLTHHHQWLTPTFPLLTRRGGIGSTWLPLQSTGWVGDAVAYSIHITASGRKKWERETFLFHGQIPEVALRPHRPEFKSMTTPSYGDLKIQSVSWMVIHPAKIWDTAIK